MDIVLGIIVSVLIVGTLFLAFFGGHDKEEIRKIKRKASQRREREEARLVEERLEKLGVTMPKRELSEDEQVARIRKLAAAGDEHSKRLLEEIEKLDE